MTSVDTGTDSGTAGAARHDGAPRSDAIGTEARGLTTFIDGSPSPYHACASAAALLEAAGFARLDEGARWPREPGRYYLIRAGSLVAWSTEQARGSSTPFRIVGAHTDSPNLRLKPQPDLYRGRWQLLGVETYGGPLLNSWLDRDLGLSGRVGVRTAAGVDERLLLVDRPILRVPQLAIHLDRSIRDDGLKLNNQQHLNPVWGVGSEPAHFNAFLAAELDVDVADILGFELMTHDLAPSRPFGREEEFLSAPRLDNLASCYAGVRALCTAVGESGSDGADGSGVVPVLALFDHEEVGSMSDRGAQSTLLPAVLERIVLAAEGDREDLLRALSQSVCASGDMAHATHPNYPERHEPNHFIYVNQGPVLKVNQNLRYASDARSTSALVLACEQAGVPLQRFVNRSDLPCGSTIGPLTAAGIGVSTVDVGIPQLAMHSAREMCGSTDPALYVAALGAFLDPAGP